MKLAIVVALLPDGFTVLTPALNQLAVAVSQVPAPPMPIVPALVSQK